MEAWGLEGRHFDFRNADDNDNDDNDGNGGKGGGEGGGNPTTGHFSQLVWKSTTSVGCGRSACDGRGGVPGWLVVCEYWPAGNVEGEFGEEVGRAVGGSWEAVGGGGGGRVGEGLVAVAAEMNGAAGGRMGKGLGVLVVVGVGVGMVVGWGV